MPDAPPRKQQDFTLNSLTFSICLPTVFFSIGERIVLPMIPLFARERGASVATAPLVIVMGDASTFVTF
jgi:hypothetical protein